MSKENEVEELNQVNLANKVTESPTDKLKALDVFFASARLMLRFIDEGDMKALSIASDAYAVSSNVLSRMRHETREDIRLSIESKKATKESNNA